MAELTYPERLASFKNSLLAIPHQRLVDILAERTGYDESLRTFLEVMTKAEEPTSSVVDLFGLAKSMITKTYGVKNLDYRNARYYVPELYAVHSTVEAIFEKGHYQLVIDLLDWSHQFEENLAGVSWPDDFLDTAYLPLAVLCLKSHLRLGKTPAEVADIFLRMGKADRYGQFYDLPYLQPADELELTQVRKQLGNSR